MSILEQKILPGKPTKESAQRNWSMTTSHQPGSLLKKTMSTILSRFNMITGGVILICLIIGILVPDIELVLGLVGSTMGSCVCTILPALMFLKLTTKVRQFIRYRI